MKTTLLILSSLLLCGGFLSAKGEEKQTRREKSFLYMLTQSKAKDKNEKSFQVSEPQSVAGVRGKSSFKYEKAEKDSSDFSFKDLVDVRVKGIKGKRKDFSRVSEPQRVAGVRGKSSVLKKEKKEKEKLSRREKRRQKNLDW